MLQTNALSKLARAYAKAGRPELVVRLCTESVFWDAGQELIGPAAKALAEFVGSEIDAARDCAKRPYDLTSDLVVRSYLLGFLNVDTRAGRQKLFLHAGVVGWRGLAIVIPGPSLTGKSMLVAELVRRGAVYYSDKFAVLDDTGAVHPYRRALVLRGQRKNGAERSRLIREDVDGPLHIGLIVATPYREGTAWRPTVLRGARAVLPSFSLLSARVKRSTAHCESPLGSHRMSSASRDSGQRRRKLPLEFSTR